MRTRHRNTGPRPHALGACALFALAAAARGGPPGPAGPTIVLPPFTVSDRALLPKPESWRYASAPGFEVLSDAGDAGIRDVLGDLLAFDRAVEAVWPTAQMRDDVPLGLVFCKNASAYREFCPNALPGESGHSFLNGDEAVMVIDDAVGRTGGSEDSGADADADTEDDLRWFLIDAVLRRVGDRAPPWLDEGLGRLLRGMTLAGDEFGFPALGSDPTLGERRAGTPGALARALQDGSFLRLAQLFAAGGPPGFRSGPEARRWLDGLRSPGTDMDLQGPQPWSNECYEFAHLCLFGAGGKYRLPFLRFALLASRGMGEEPVFRSLFGAGYGDMLGVLWRYTDFGKAEAFRIAGPGGGPAPPAPDIRFRHAADGEVGRLRGEALLCQDLTEAAHLSLIAPYLRGSRDPQLLAALGIEEARAGRDDRARLFLEAAAAAGTTRARAYAELARLRYLSCLARPEGPGGRLSAAQLRSVFGPLPKALELPPALSETYQVVADAWTHAAVRPWPANLAVIDQGVGRFPYDADLIYGDALAHLDAGDAASAASLCAFGLQTAGSAADRSRLAALRAEAEKAAEAAPKPGSR